MNESTSTSWQYLAPNPNSCYKQLFIKGTRIRARVLYGMAMSAEESMTPEESPAAAAERSALPRLTAAEMLLLVVLAALQFTHSLDYMIMMPLMPYFQHEMDISERQFGLLVASYAFSAGVSGLLAALFIDRFDRKRALLWLYFGFMVGTLLCAVAPGYVSLLLARTVAGAFGGVVSAVVLAIIGDVFSDRRRGRAMGVVMTAFSLALTRATAG